jgi:hypothetical protein
MTRSFSLAKPLCLSVALALVAGCTAQFGAVSRSMRVSDGARISATNKVPERYVGALETLALAEEVFAKQNDALRERRDSLRSRRRTLTVATYATFAATTLVISAAAIRSGSGEMATNDGLRTAGYGALGGLGLGTTLEVVNLMQEDPAAIDAKIARLDASYRNMISSLESVFETALEANLEPNEVKIKATPIIDAFINEALQMNVKG